MITKIISTADIHIRNLRRQEEYQKVLSKFIEQCRNIKENNNEGDTRIVVVGDLLHNKLDISGEGYLLASWFLKKLDEICPTIVIAGNHDMNMANTSRLDPITAIFSMCSFKQTIYLDSVLDYSSGCYSDDNVVWCLYSSFDNFSAPNIDEFKIDNPKSRYIGLFHGEINSAMDDAGYISENGLDSSHFNGVDFCICGHIHKFQEIEYKGTKLVYCSSLIQQSHGENVSMHGYVVWDIKKKKESYEFVEISNKDYGFYTIKIGSIDDLDENTESFLNL